MSSPIGIIDSGVGGLTVLKEIVAVLPHQHYIYCADTKHVPYGEKSIKELVELVKHTVQYLVKQNVSLIVIACNTVSGAVLTEIEKEYPHITFIQMIQHGLQGVTRYSPNSVGVLATQSTIREGTYIKRLLEYFPYASIQALPAPQLVLWAEQGNICGGDVESYIQTLYRDFRVQPDLLILACTHFPYFMQIFSTVVSQYTHIYNPASSIAQYIVSLVEPLDTVQSVVSPPNIDWYITGKSDIVYTLASQQGLL